MFNNFKTSLDVTSGIQESFSLFLGDNFGEFFLVFLELDKVIEDVTLTDEDGDVSPFFEGSMSSFDGFVEFFVGGLRSTVDKFLGGLLS